MYHPNVLFNVLPHLASDHRFHGEECAHLGHSASPAAESRAHYPQLQVRQVDPKVTFSGQFLLSGSPSLPSLQLSLVLSEANHGMARPTSEQCPQGLQSSPKNISGEGASTSGVKSQSCHSCLSSWGVSFVDILGLANLDLILFRVPTSKFPYNRKCQIHMRGDYIPTGPPAWGLVKHGLDQAEATGNMGVWPSTPVYICEC